MTIGLIIDRRAKTASKELFSYSTCSSYHLLSSELI